MTEAQHEGETRPTYLPQTSGLAIASLVLGILGFTCFSILTGIPALILGIISLGKINKSSGAVTGKGMAIAGIVLGSLSILWLPIMAGFLVPTLMKARSAADEVRCQSNMRELSKLVQMYAATHGGAVPATLAELKDEEASLDRFTRCPSDTDPGPSYELLQGGKRFDDLPPSSVLLREIRPNHRESRNVVSADGSVERLPPGR